MPVKRSDGLFLRGLLSETFVKMSRDIRCGCPFAAAVLTCLAGAIDTDCDRKLAEVCLKFMEDELRQTVAELETTKTETKEL